MARATKLIALSNVLLQRQATRSSRTGCGYGSQGAAVAQVEQEEPEVQHVETQHYKLVRRINWIPHPRSGIYFPEGEEGVMNSVPDNASSLGQAHTYWLRDLDGVEKHDPDVSSADHYFLRSMHLTES